LYPRIKEVKQKLEEITSHNKKVLTDIDTYDNQIDDYMQRHVQKQALVEKRE